MKRLRTIILLITFSLLSVLPPLSYATDSRGDGTMTDDLYCYENNMNQMNDSRQEELLLEYMESESRMALCGESMNAAQIKRGVLASSLSEEELLAYDAIRERAEEIASGETANLELAIPYIFFTGGKNTFSAEELGLESIWRSSEQTRLTDKAKIAICSLHLDDFSKVYDAVIEDCPYLFYWSAGSSYGVSMTDYSREGDAVSFDEDTTCIQVDFFVDKKYCADKEYSSTYGYGHELDSTMISKAAIAADNAAEIVKTNASKSDVNKLIAYKTAIEELVDYDDNASENEADNDPWNVVYVFDKIPSTKAVCEGYSISFKYLCDLTDFDSNEIKVITATGSEGDSSGFGHMWDVVHMDDGNNYIADITYTDKMYNVSQNTLFLSGASKGNITDGYYFNGFNGSSTFYYKYDEDTIKKYGTSLLTISSSNYLKDESINAVNDDTKEETVVGRSLTLSGNEVKVLTNANGTKPGTVAFIKAKNKKSVTVPATVKINNKAFKVTQINSKAFTGKKIRTVTVGANVKTIKANAFKSSRVTKIVVKSKLLTKKTVKKSLKGSKVKIIQVKIGSKKVNKQFAKKYKKIFTKAVAGAKVTVK